MHPSKYLAVKRISARCALMAIALLTAVPAVAKQEILKPEEAFRYEVTATADEVVVNWTIEPEHYLYKERMSFATETPGVVLGTAVGRRSSAAQAVGRRSSAAQAVGRRVLPRGVLVSRAVGRRVLPPPS